MTDRVSGRSNRSLIITSPTGGVYATLPLGSTHAFQPELLFSPRGVEVNLGGLDPDLPLDLSATLKLNYVELPLLLRVDIPTTGGIAPHLYGGPSLAFNTGGQAAADVAGTSASADCDDADVGFDAKSLDVGATIGGGIGFPLAGGRALTVGVCYTFGLTNVFDGGEGTDGVDPRNRVLAVYGAFDVPLRR